jgi:hypothetical protein
MIEAWNELTTLDWIGFTLLVIVCTVAAALMRSMLQSTSMAVLAYPVLILGALAANAVFREFGIVIVYDRAANAVVATGVGMMVGAVVALVLTRLAAAMQP